MKNPHGKLSHSPKGCRFIDKPRKIQKEWWWYEEPTGIWVYHDTMKIHAALIPIKQLREFLRRYDNFPKRG